MSFLARIEELGGVYRDKGQPRPALSILRSRGSNLARLRLWVEPDGQNMNVSSLSYTLALARRAKAEGFEFLLDIHYSDTWADPGSQAKPRSWQGLKFQDLTARVESYSREVMQAFVQAGAAPEIVQVGNETPNGMLWPDGEVQKPGGWRKYGDLLKAALRGVRSGAGGAKAPLLMIHINNGHQKDLWKWFFTNLKPGQQGIDFDLIGLSHYPEAGMKLSELRESLSSLASEMRKPILLVETGFPFSGVPESEHARWEFAPTPEGQRQYLEALIALMRAVPNGLGRGVVWWEPTWIPVEGLGHYSNNKMLFDRDGNALPALDALSALSAKAK